MKSGHRSNEGVEKIGYLSKKEAKQAILSLYAARRAEEGSLHSYKCPECGCYHIGHTSQYNIMSKQKNLAMKRIENQQQDPQTKDPIEVILNQVGETIKAKNHDYGNAFDESYEMFGRMYGASKIYEKTKRIITLSKEDPQVKDESLADSLMDCIGYCTLYLAELMKS